MLIGHLTQYGVMLLGLQATDVLVTGVVFDCPGNRECGWQWRRQFHYKQIRSYGGRLEGLKLL